MVPSSAVGDKGCGIIVRNSRVTGSQKSEAENKKQTLDPLDPKTGGQSQLTQLEAKMKEQMQQLQSQVADPASVFVCICISSLLASAALASRCPTAWRTQWLRCK